MAPGGLRRDLQQRQDEEGRVGLDDAATPRRSGGVARATLFDVAARARVSSSTVSRVVNGQPYIAAATRARVEQAMAELGYVADLRARALAGGRTDVIGLVLLDLRSSYMADVVRAVDDEVAKSGYDLMLTTTHSRHGDPTQQVMRMARGMADGVLILAPLQQDRYLADLQAARYPHVLIDDQSEPGSSQVVRARNEEGVRAGAEHLLALGHRHLLHVEGDHAQPTAAIRCTVFVETVRRGGARVETVPGGYDDDDGYVAALPVLRRPQAERPTAVFAANDASAFGVLRAARECGLDVPGDLSVLGFDDVLEARVSTPRLSTVRQPLADIGASATRLLLEQIQDPGTGPRLVELPTELVVRESTGPAPHP